MMTCFDLVSSESTVAEAVKPSEGEELTSFGSQLLLKAVEPQSLDQGAEGQPNSPADGCIDQGIVPQDAPATELQADAQIAIAE